MIGAGRSFIAGADIRHSASRAPTPRRTHLRCARRQQASRSSPRSTATRWAAAWSIALACHYRIAVPSAKVGLPEVLIGILPGGGGTQRLPRLIGPKAAMEMIVSGRHVPAEEAETLGIIDEIVAGQGPARRGHRLRQAHRRQAAAAARARQDRQAGRGQGRSRHVRRHAQVDRAQGAQPEGALPLHRLRRGGGARSRSTKASQTERRLFARARELRRGQGPALRVLRRARGGQDPRPAEGPAAARDQDGRGGRRRHHGRRHRHELRRLRLPGEAARRLAGGADQGHASASATTTPSASSAAASRRRRWTSAWR